MNNNTKARFKRTHSGNRDARDAKRQTRCSPANRPKVCGKNGGKFDPPEHFTEQAFYAKYKHRANVPVTV